MLKLEQAIDQVPQWSGTRVSSVPLEHGQTNRSFLITQDEQHFVLRLNHPSSKALGLDRSREQKILWFAHAAGLGPQPVFAAPTGDFLVTRWIPGSVVSAGQLNDELMIGQIARALRRVHQWSITGPRLSFTRTARRYIENTAHDEDGSLAELQREIVGVVDQLKGLPAVTCLCHNDPLHSNFVLTEHLHLLDWEYAAWGDPLFDLATLANYHNFGSVKADFLLRAYSVEVPDGRRQVFDLNRILSRALSELWSHAVVGGAH